MFDTKDITSSVFFGVYFSLHGDKIHTQLSVFDNTVQIISSFVLTSILK